MPKIYRRGLPWIVIAPAVAVMAFDFFVTMAGQSREYWTDHEQALEGAPHGLALLRNGPLYFSVAFAAYVVALVLAMRRLPQVVAVPLVFWIVLGHASASMTWFDNYLMLNVSYELTYYLTFGFYGLVALVFGLAFYYGVCCSPNE